jgi:hypothetical protein
MMPYCMAWTFLVVLLSGTLSHATEITGNWLVKNPSGDSVFLSFGDTDDFFIEDETSWIQGTYVIQSDAFPGQLDLYIQDGVNGEDIGKTVRCLYHVHDNLLTLTGTDQGETNPPTTLEAVNPSGSTVFIGINTDPPDKDDENDEDKDDYNWNVYASCFVMSSKAE